MSTTSLLHHAFGVHGYVYQRSEYVGGEICFTVEQPDSALKCSVCESKRVIRRGGRERRFRGLPIGKRAVWIALKVPRLECKVCGAVRQAEVSFAPGQHSYTKRLAGYIVELAEHMTMQDVAEHLGVSWNLVKELLKEALRKRFGRPELKDLRLLAIDEISIGRGHRYLTVVMDLETGAVVFIGKGKGASALAPFWKRLKRAGAAIEAVAIDMSQAYMNAVGAHLPHATLVFDHFHVVKLMNDKLSDLRRTLQRQAAEQDKEVLKGTRWLLLKAPENLDETRSEVERLKAALDLNTPLAAAYYLKEDLRQLWSQPDKEYATRFLGNWTKRGLRDRYPTADPDVEHPQPASSRHPRLLRRAHQYRPARGHQQQDQDPPAAGLRIPRHGVLLPPHLRPTPLPLRTRRIRCADGNR